MRTPRTCRDRATSGRNTVALPSAAELKKNAPRILGNTVCYFRVSRGARRQSQQRVFPPKSAPSPPPTIALSLLCLTQLHAHNCSGATQAAKERRQLSSISVTHMTALLLLATLQQMQVGEQRGLGCCF